MGRKNISARLWRRRNLLKVTTTIHPGTSPAFVNTSRDHLIDRTWRLIQPICRVRLWISPTYYVRAFDVRRCP